MRSATHFLTHPKDFLSSFLKKYGSFLPDPIYLRWQYRLLMGKKLNLSHPRTFNEKLQWLKIHNRKPEMTAMVDKFAVKDYVAEKIGKEYVIQTLGVWYSLEEVEWDSLPNSFVLKTTHGGGGTGVVVVKDKSKVSREETLNKLRWSFEQDGGYVTYREWPYKNVPKRIIAEKYVVDQTTGDLRDYKFYCFDGKPKAMLVASERFTSDHPYFDYFDMEKNHLPFTQGGENNPKTPKLPDQFDKMKELAASLSVGIPHVRVDFYEANGQVFFGELTFYDSSGYAKFEPEEWDGIFGSWIKLWSPII